MIRIRSQIRSIGSIALQSSPSLIERRNAVLLPGSFLQGCDPADKSFPSWSVDLCNIHKIVHFPSLKRVPIISQFSSNFTMATPPEEQEKGKYLPENKTAYGDNVPVYEIDTGESDEHEFVETKVLK